MARSFTFSTITEYRAAKASSGTVGAIYAELVSSGIKSGSCVSKITSTGDVFIDSINPFVTPELGQEGDTLYYSSTEGYRFLRAGNTTWDADSYGQVYIDLAKIPSGFSVVAPYTDIFNYKKTDENIGSGKASMTKILGNTVAWNQLKVGGTATFSGISKTQSSNGKLTYKATSTTASYMTETAVSNCANHKILIQLKDLSVTPSKDVRFYFIVQKSDGSATEYILKTASSIYTCGGNVASISTMVDFRQATAAVGDELSAFINIYDLTLMFGAGNEPATVAEFEALFPLPYYAYNAGTLISNKAKAIEFVGFNKWDEEGEVGNIVSTTGENADSASGTNWRSKNYIPVFPGVQYYCKSDVTTLARYYNSNKEFLGKDYNVNINGNIFTTPANAAFVRFVTGDLPSAPICINLSDASKNGTYEPYKKVIVPLNLDSFYVRDSNGVRHHITGGLKSAGSVYDEIVGNKLIRRVGSVDLGRLTWYKQTTMSGHFRFFVANFISGGTYNVISDRYVTGNTWVSSDAKTISLNAGNNQICISDEAYADAAVFKAAMSGVFANYELATPIEYEIYSPTKMPFNWKYRVSEYHTKKMLPENEEEPTSAPFACEIKQI